MLITSLGESVVAANAMVLIAALTSNRVKSLNIAFASLAVPCRPLLGCLRLASSPGLLRPFGGQISNLASVDVEYDLTLPRVGVLDRHRRSILLVNCPSGQIRNE